MGKKLYVGNMSFKATEEDIKGLFAGVGEVASVNIITDARTGQAKGFGFVEMATEEAAKKAIETLNGPAFIYKENLKTRSFFEKPSEKKKRKQREARKKRMKALRFKRPSD